MRSCVNDRLSPIVDLETTLHFEAQASIAWDSEDRVLNQAGVGNVMRRSTRGGSVLVSTLVAVATVGICGVVLRCFLPEWFYARAIPLSETSQAQPEEAPSGNGLARARTLIEQGKLDQAIVLLNELIQKQPQMPGAEAKLGKAYSAKRDYERAVFHLEKALKQNPDDPESTELLGFTYYLLGRWQQAIPLLERLHSPHPGPNVTLFYMLGIAYVKDNQYDRARAAFANAFSLPPDSPQARLILGQMFLPHQLEAKAIPELQHALVKDSRLPMAHYILGEIYRAKSQLQLALEEFEKERQVNPGLWLVYWRIGDIYARLENWDEAERALRQALLLNQDFVGPYILLGKMELKKGNAELARGYLERAVKMDPSDYSAHYLLGTTYKRLGREADAAREFGLSESLRSSKEP